MPRPPTGEILIVDDEPRIGSALARILAAEGHRVETRSEPQAALEALEQHPYDVLLSDLVMPGMDGIELLRRARTIRPACEVVVMTAYATVETAREALKRGAADYLTKPFSAERELKPLIRDLLAAGAAEEERAPRPPPLRAAGAPAAAAAPLAGLVGRSPPMRELVEKLPRVARSDATVLLRGESGTGKEVVARAIHRLSPRAERPLVTVNCAALPEGLLESELFGVVRGAFTGADRDRAGLFQAADGGSILLDEVAEMPASLQAKLLRVLQEGEFHRVGDARRAVRADVRAIAATNRDLEEAVRSGSFRKDLYYRLNVVPIRLPPLRERRADLPLLLDHFAAQLAPGRRLRFSDGAQAALEAYEWPGNVRELENAVEHAAVLGEGDRSELEDLPAPVQDASRWVRSPVRAGRPPATLDEIEAHTILQAMAKTGLNRTRAAKLLGITRRTLGCRIHKYGLEPELEALSERGAEHRRTGPLPARPGGSDHPSNGAA